MQCNQGRRIAEHQVHEGKHITVHSPLIFDPLTPFTGGEGPWNWWKHLGNIEGTGSIFLRRFHQTRFDYIWNVTITCTQDGTAGNIWVTSGM